jgi:hypothetical protein
VCVQLAGLTKVRLYHSDMMDPMMVAILASGVVAVLIGMIWYHPKVFGSAWMRWSNITPEMAERGKRKMPLMAFFGFLAATLVAYVMSYVSAAWGFYSWDGALQLGFWCWLGFVAPTMLGSVLWEQKPFRLYLINAFYWLVVMLVMAQMIVFAYGLQYAAYVNSGVLDEAAYVE